MKIARVFPSRTSMTPTDPDAFVGLPDLFTKQYDEVHISVTFTWDIPKVEYLKKEWGGYGKVLVGGPAYDLPSDHMGSFVVGRYLRQGVSITSRGCPNNCPHCFVPKREGKIRTLPITKGNVIQDNNLLACPKSHRDVVFSMLKTQRHIDFAGGFEATRVTDEIVEQLRGLRIYQMWLAYDHPNAEKPLQQAVNRLSKCFKRDKMRCYVLIGYKDDTMEKAENRLRRAWEIGTLPFAMLYKDENGKIENNEWRRFQRNWARPAIIKSRCSPTSKQGEV